LRTRRAVAEKILTELEHYRDGKSTIDLIQPKSIDIQLSIIEHHLKMLELGTRSATLTWSAKKLVEATGRAMAHKSIFGDAELDP